MEVEGFADPKTGKPVGGYAIVFETKEEAEAVVEKLKRLSDDSTEPKAKS